MSASTPAEARKTAFTKSWMKLMVIQKKQLSPKFKCGSNHLSLRPAKGLYSIDLPK
jgi:hypothetical protein